MAKVVGGQAFKPSLFPATRYINSLLNAYYPDITFDSTAYLSAFRNARNPQFDAAWANLSNDGASLDRQLCWCLVEISPGTVLPLHAHTNLEVSYTLKGCVKERAVSRSLPVERLRAGEIDWLDCGAAKVEDAVYPAGCIGLYTPGSCHQIYTDKGSEVTVLLMVYSKECTFIRATDPAVSRQLLPTSTSDKSSSTYLTSPVVRSAASFATADPRYARYRSSGVPISKAVEMTVAQVAVKALADCGVRDAIVYPGAKCIELLKQVDNNSYGIRGWLCRNEHAGAFVAEGYNKSQSDRLCVVMTTSGPGATNLATGIASAWRDGVPLIVITSQVPSYKTGTAAFQEVPVCEMYQPITKGTFGITDPSQVYNTVVKACRLAVEGVNGPVVIDIPEDLQAQVVSVADRRLCQVAPPPPSAAIMAASAASETMPTQPLQANAGTNGWGVTGHRQGLRSHVSSPIRQSVMKQVLHYIKVAQQPLLLLGGGVVGVDEGLLNELVHVLDMPVAYTFMGKGCISDDHPLCLGPVGVHGLSTANWAMQHCDLLIAIGCRFDERAACKSMDLWKNPPPVVHVDIAAQTSMSGSPKNPITCNVVADAADFVGVLLQHLYGFIDDRRRALSMALPSMQVSGNGKMTEVDDFSDFVVDEDDLLVLQEAKAMADARSRAPAGPQEVSSQAEEEQPGSAKKVQVASVKSPFADVAGSAGSASSVTEEFSFHAGHANSSGGGSAAAAVPASPTGPARAALSSLNLSGAEWHMYLKWTQDMSDMKARRWRTLMPCLAPKSELTTRDMVHLLDSYLSQHGLEPIVCSDVGSHQCLLAQYLRLHHPRQWLMEGGLASMGCGLPSAIGAALANPGVTCLAVAGDGGFAMTSQELMMAKVYKLNVKVIVTVNNRLQLVEQLEEETFDALDVFTFLGDPDHPHRPYPNFAKVAEAYGVPAITAWNHQELLDGFSLMFGRPGPMLMEVVALAERPHIKYWDSAEQ